MGKISYQSNSVVESDGEAFLLSGTALDSMKNTNTRLLINTPWKEINDELLVSCSFADSVISQWSVFQAEAFYHYYTKKDLTQDEIAKQLSISQSSLSRRLHSGSLKNIELFENRFRNLIKSKNDF
ncbi:MAG: hypothetical protein IPO21_05170 [Bacteroidales bacterium]|nr:hypothetical protein [Bacteroidales bacterium]